MTSDIEIAKADWETYCSKIADQVVQEQTPANLLKIRGNLYELLSHCIPAPIVLKVSRFDPKMGGMK
jgi:replication factor C subunit 3/5